MQLILCISCVALCQCVSMNVHTYLWAVNWSVSLCVCVLPLRASWCVCMCEQASFCLWVWMKTSSSPPVWVWSGCSVSVNVAPVCCNPVVWASHAPSVKEAQPWSLTYTRPWSLSHLQFLLFFNHPFCQCMSITAVHFCIVQTYVKRICPNSPYS